MKQQENNEIESLLRSWSGRQSAASTSGSATAQSSSDHMDVDELNAYAEGDLPAATRARYVSHLVDCDDCRKIVGQLTVASGKAVIEPAVSVVLATPWWKQTMSALFAPAVLKFALPTLVLLLIGVAFFGTRSPSANNANAPASIAESGKAVASPTTSDATLSGFVAANQPTSGRQQEKATATPGDGAPAAGEKAAAKEQKNEDRPEASAAVDDVKKAPEPAKENEPAESRQERPRAAPQTVTVAPAPPPPAAAKPASNATPKDTETYSSAGQPLADKAARKREAEKQRNDREADKRSDEGETNSSDSTAGRDEERQKAKTLSAAGAAASRRGENEPTRTVAGRRFYQRDGVWFDTSFKSGMSVTSVTRGSDQYRALVADEPEIATIANQLSGQIYVIWKGRGYHIK